MRYSLWNTIPVLGLTGWLSASAIAQQPISYDIVDLDDRAVYYTDCNIFSSPNHQHVWLACDASVEGTYSLNTYFLFPISADGHVGAKVKINLTSRDWGLSPEDRLIGLSDANQFVLLNLKTSEMVLLPTVFAHKGDRPTDADAKRQPISNMDAAFTKNPNGFKILNSAFLNQNTSLILVKQNYTMPDLGEDNELTEEIVGTNNFWLLRLQNNGQQWMAEDITKAATANPEEYDALDRSEQNLIVNSQGVAMLYDASVEAESQSLYCFNAATKTITNQVVQGNFSDPILAVLPNGNFILGSYKEDQMNEKPVPVYLAYRTVFTPQCKQIGSVAWGLKPNQFAQAVNVSQRGDMFLVYTDYQPQGDEEVADDNVTPNSLHLAKFGQDGKLAWTKELVGKIDVWLPYLNLVLPMHADEAVKYNMQINFSGDGKQVLVMVYNSFQSEIAEEMLAKDPKNLLPRIYQLPIN